MTATAARQRRYRERIRAGRVCITVEIDRAVLGDILREAGALSRGRKMTRII